MVGYAMCHFLTIGISGGSLNPEDVFRSHTLHAEPGASPQVRAAMPQSAALFGLTVGGCSCSIYLSDAIPEVDEEAERARYARKGWSAAKITRAIASKQAANEQRRRNSRRREFCLSVESLVRGGARVSLFSHFYSGSLAEEVVDVVGQVRVPVAEFVEAHGAFPEDTLVTIM